MLDTKTATGEATLIVDDLHVSVAGKEILQGVDLEIPKGEVHALLGPNGSGKSTLAYTLAGHPKYEVTQGRAIWKGQNLLELSPDERAKLGIFLAFQYPTAIPGVTVANFLRLAVKNVLGDVPAVEFRRQMRSVMSDLKMDDTFATRYLNEGFSGGEKKRAEILQLAMLKPQLAILDETDSGLDIDAMRVVADGINKLKNPEMGVMIITHYNRFLNYIRPDRVHILHEGRIVRSGGQELAEELERLGYDKLLKEVQADGR
ncbi:MAG TPA: Fe-S cluster assembly ATPase SufC [Chloroflexota bacterium]|jgi:Fe-S cluster assembly ATP-binding protein|nr:Fe-S cluster assembly ATPase SufC [Chloroflexota bacterium]